MFQLNTTKDHKLLQQLGFTNEQHIKVRTYTATAAPPPYSNDDVRITDSINSGRLFIKSLD